MISQLSNRLPRVAALALGLMLLMPSIAMADVTFADGDGAVPVSSANNPLKFDANPSTATIDPLCVGQSYTDSALIAIQRAGASSDGQRVFGNGVTVTISLQTPPDDSPALSEAITDSTILLPTNWTSVADGTMSTDPSIATTNPSGEVSVTVVPPAATSTTPASGNVLIRANGQNAIGGSVLNRNASLKVEWTAINCDSTPPVISPNVTGTLGSNDWYTSNVGVSWTVVDNESSISSSTGCGSTSISADTTGTVVTCSATSSGGTAQQSVTIKRDATQPVVNVTGVSNGATYTLGSVPAAGCTTSDATSGVQTNATLSSSGGPVGSVTATCSGALDNAGNSGSASATYTVEYAFTGFFQPVDNLPAFNQAKAGSAIPVKFSLGGNQGLSIFSAGSPGSFAIECDSSDPLDTVEQTVTAGSSGLSYDPTTNQYTYVWKTQKSWTGCRQLVVQLADGTSHVANFKFTR